MNCLNNNSSSSSLDKHFCEPQKKHGWTFIVVIACFSIEAIAKQVSGSFMFGDTVLP